MHRKRTGVAIKGKRKKKKPECLGTGAGCPRDCGSLSLEIFQVAMEKAQNSLIQLSVQPCFKQDIGPDDLEKTLRFTYGMPMLSNTLRTYGKANTFKSCVRLKKY